VNIKEIRLISNGHGEMIRSEVRFRKEGMLQEEREALLF
jgi:hypothetical protein